MDKLQYSFGLYIPLSGTWYFGINGDDACEIEVNGQVVASFGDHRKYSYKGKRISESYHLGLDLASNAMASIKPQNGGDVVYSDYNGLYGNMPMIHHGLGLYTLSSSCCSLRIFLIILLD